MQLNDEQMRKTLNHMAILGQYGRVMLSAQLLESQLMMLAMVASVKDPHASPRRVDTKRVVSRVFKKAIHLNFKATAKEARNLVAHLLSEEQLQELDRAISWRNRLAHNYLREKITGSADGQFAPGTLDELVKLTKAFDSLGKELAKQHERITESWPSDFQPPPEMAEFLEGAMMRLLQGKPPAERQTREATTESSP